MEESRRAVSVRQLEEELQRERRRTKRRKRRRIALVCLLVLLILLIVLGSGFSTVLRISGDAMAGTLRDGDIAVGLKSSHYRSGDVVVFRFNSGVLVKRLLAQSGDWVELDPAGWFFVNGARLNEPYVTETSRGNCDVVFPLTIPEGSCFVAGDNRPVSIDSRSSVVGCVEESALVGKLLLRIWPITRIGLIH